ncbi:uncharacterized protein [Rutidosis leptorrhynchoides]|uniref:uncharacterized protein n=1 Tax=Rutidosis leptorrhynchoides TaxID=125765 RepID=UPI003A98E391
MMVNRKERRLAAKTGSNRRVKLDILAEPPSGDFGDSLNKEVGGGGKANNDAGSHNSPSSSGERPENPLLLLGQYSDDEAEKESDREINHNTENNSLDELNDQQVKVENQEATRTRNEENITTDEAVQENMEPFSSLDVFPKLEENGVMDNNTVESLHNHKQTDAVEQASVSLSSGAQTTGNVDSGWKMVLHDESNSYYYWNIVTGETSWEVPAVLTQGNESVYDLKSAPEAENKAEMYGYVATQPNNGSTNGTVVEANNDSKTELEVHDEKFTNVVANDYGEAHNTDSSIQDMSVHMYQGEDEYPSSDSSSLLQLGENLLERLNSIKGSEEFDDQISKLKFELHIRLADIKSLVPYGSSLLPFWLHSENQMKKLEAAVNNQVLKYSQTTNVGKMDKPEFNLHDALPDNSTPDGSHHILADSTPEVDTVETHVKATPADTVPNVGPHSAEDADMDVEMEVEDEHEPETQPNQSIQLLPHEEDVSRGSKEDIDNPQPPNDEWIPPPPPPDEEPLPPPPPDEPPEAPFPPPASDLQTAQSYSYGEQYNLTYPVSGYEYYGQTNTQVPSNGYYVDANGCQVAAPVPSLYYAPVPNPYPNVNSIMNHVESVNYYSLQGSVPIASNQSESSKDVSSISSSTLFPVTSIVNRDASVVSAPAVTTTVTSTEPVPKVQPKVTRNKKRTAASVSTLRSNKKVSGLVDKWKAVKEELHEEEEDEPENPLEVLEKKRQREIEQWHAQQIASGEAKDNANFQPLGGDWRERVRRKRAKKSAEVEETLAKTINDTDQPPDLVELTKQLPSGWQAYWDEGSKQVYYGNSKTSETTWVKPAN